MNLSTKAVAETDVEQDAEADAISISKAAAETDAEQDAAADADFVADVAAETDAEQDADADASINAAAIAPSSASGAAANGENPSIVYLKVWWATRQNKGSLLVQLYHEVPDDRRSSLTTLCCRSEPSSRSL